MMKLFQDLVGCSPVSTGTVGLYELDLFFTKLVADAGIGDELEISITAIVSNLILTLQH
jgi:hypothetical protein